MSLLSFFEHVWVLVSEVLADRIFKGLLNLNLFMVLLLAEFLTSTIRKRDDLGLIDYISVLILEIFQKGLGICCLALLLFFNDALGNARNRILKVFRSLLSSLEEINLLLASIILDLLVVLGAFLGCRGHHLGFLDLFWSRNLVILILSGVSISNFFDGSCHHLGCDLTRGHWCRCWSYLSWDSDDTRRCALRLSNINRVTEDGGNVSLAQDYLRKLLRIHISFLDFINKHTSLCNHFLLLHLPPQNFMLGDKLSFLVCSLLHVLGLLGKSDLLLLLLLPLQLLLNFFQDSLVCSCLLILSSGFEQDVFGGGGRSNLSIHVALLAVSEVELLHYCR